MSYQKLGQDEFYNQLYLKSCAKYMLTDIVIKAGAKPGINSIEHYYGKEEVYKYLKYKKERHKCWNQETKTFDWEKLSN